MSGNVLPSFSRITLGDVEREQARPRFTLRFPQDMELSYRHESVEERRSAVIASWGFALCLFNIFLICDYFICGDDFRIYAIGRAGVITPLGAIILTCLVRNEKYFDILICLLQVVIAVGLTILLMAGHGPYREAYFFGNILLFICGYVISRPPFFHALVTASLQSAGFVATALWSDIMSADGKVVSIFFCVCGVAVTMVAAYTLDRMGRRAFLLGLRVRLLNDRLLAMATRDPLTGLGNRRLFEEATSGFWASANDTPTHASLILIDIDRFKAFNDSRGHTAGDLCLKAVGERIAQSIGEKDLAVRFGGEEMVVFLPNSDFASAWMVAARIKAAIIDEAIQHPALGPDVVVTASLGVATALTTDCTPGELVERADLALYAAKHNGRNQVWPPEDSSEYHAAWSGVPQASEPQLDRWNGPARTATILSA